MVLQNETARLPPSKKVLALEDWTLLMGVASASRLLAGLESVWLLAIRYALSRRRWEWTRLASRLAILVESSVAY